MGQKVETEFGRKLSNLGELLSFSDGSNIAEHEIDKLIVLTVNDWKEFVSDFTKEQFWIPKSKKMTLLVESASGSPLERVVVQNEGYSHARYVGLVW